MSSELRVKNVAQQLYVRALSAAWRSGVALHDPSLWLTKHPDLEERMLRDADIKHAVQMRRHKVAGKAWQLTPLLANSPRAPMAVMIGTELLKGIKHFTTARLNLARAFFSGARFARIHGCVKELPLGDGLLRKWWIPTRLEDVDKKRYRIVADTDQKTGVINAHWERWNVGREQFEPETIADAKQTVRHVYQDDEASLGHGRGLREALAWWWYAKEHVFVESLQAVERFAQGIITAKVDGIRDAKTGEPNTELIRLWRDVLEDLRARHVLVYDAADQVEHVQMNGEGWNLLRDIREELRQTITVLILGSNLPTTATQGGSYALGSVQENSTETLIGYDRETLDDTISDDVLGCVWWKNYPNMRALGIDQEMPRYSTTDEKQQNPKERAETASVLHGMGVDLAQDDVAEQTGFRVPEPGEPVVKGSSPPPAGEGFGPPFRR